MLSLSGSLVAHIPKIDSEEADGRSRITYVDLGIRPIRALFYSLMNDQGLFLGPDGATRCWWCSATPLYVDYHDNEWGLPVTDDRRLFEKITLEGFQSGLSWLTILRKREHFREAFAGFDFARIARFGQQDVERLLSNEGIVRHRGKIESAINNAKRACELASECGSLAAYAWRFEPGSRAAPATQVSIPSQTPESVAMSKDLKKRGWSFVGPTTLYAFMQAMGLVNDHLEGCVVRPRAEQARRALDKL